MAKTSLFVVAPQLVPGAPITLPDPAGAQQSVPAGKSVVEVTINLSLADKLAIGTTLTLAAYFSTDAGLSWQFANGFDWQSYGPGGLTVTDPDGAVRVNPDPRLHVPLNGRTGSLARVVVTPGSPLVAGLTLMAF